MTRIEYPVRCTWPRTKDRPARIPALLMGLAAVVVPSVALGAPPLVDRVTDFNRVMTPEEHARLGVELQDLYDAAGSDFYLVLVDEPAEQSVLDLAKQYQQSTVPSGFGGVLVCDLARRELGVYLAPASRSAVGEKELGVIVERNLDTLSSMPAVRHRIAKLTLAIVNDVVQARQRAELLDKRRAGAGWLLAGVFAAVAACVAAGALFLLRLNLFGKTFHFPEEQGGPGRFGGRYSGGHGASIRFDE